MVQSQKMVLHLQATGALDNVVVLYENQKVSPATLEEGILIKYTYQKKTSQTVFQKHNSYEYLPAMQMVGQTIF